jgi:hypothetical protein
MTFNLSSDPAGQEEPGSLQEQAQAIFGSCNWSQGLPVPAFFELRAMAKEAVTDQAVSFLSGFWYCSRSDTHAARVQIGSRIEVWRLGAVSARWYS